MSHSDPHVYSGIELYPIVEVSCNIIVSWTDLFGLMRSQNLSHKGLKLLRSKIMLFCVVLQTCNERECVLLCGNE